MLLSNLAVSDLLMGVYMLVIASADIYFGKYFSMQSEMWRTSATCRITGAISIISSEASVFFVTLISIDRFICIRFPFSKHKLNKKISLCDGHNYLDNIPSLGHYSIKLGWQKCQI